MAGKRGMSKYTQETKLKAVKLFLEGERTKRSILKELGIRNETQLEGWTRAYRQAGEAGLQPKPKGRPKKRQGEETLEEKVARLEMENELLRSFLLEAGRK